MAPENQCILCDPNLCSCRGGEEKVMCFMEKWSGICDFLGAIASPGSDLHIPSFMGVLHEAAGSVPVFKMATWHF